MEALVVVALLWAVFGRNSAPAPVEEPSVSTMTGIVPLSMVPGHYLRADAARAFERAVSQSNIPRVNSSFRTREQQEKLYALYLAGKGNLAAKPGTSKHEFGLAIDARGSTEWESAMSANGWRRTVNSEPWHWEYFG